MTIIQPHKNSGKANFLILVLIMTSVSLTVWGVFLYNQLVSLRHEIKNQENALSRTEVENAELRNNLYSTISRDNLESLLNTQPLILDKNPEYVRTKELTMNN